jgi:hypothetical protein
MPTYPSTNISNLKQATGILSNDLFDHAPGSPNEVKMSDFLCNGVGNFTEANQRLLRCVLYDGIGVDGSYNTNNIFKFDSGDGPIRPGIPFEILIKASPTDLGAFYSEQCMEGGTVLSIDEDITSNAVTINSITNNLPSGISGDGVVVNAEIDSLVNPLQIGLVYNDPYNSHADNQGTTSISGFSSPVGLAFKTDDVAPATAIYTGWNIRVTYRDSLPNKSVSGWEVDVEPQDTNGPFDGPNVYDPAGVSSTHDLYTEDPFSNSRVDRQSSGEFLSGDYPPNYPLELKFTKFPSGSTKDVYFKLTDSADNIWDVVQCRLLRDDWPTTDGTSESYTFVGNEGRNPGTLQSPYQLTKT